MNYLNLKINLLSWFFYFELKVYGVRADIVVLKNVYLLEWVKRVIFFNFNFFFKAIQQNRDPIGYTKRTRRYPPIKQILLKENTIIEQNSSLSTSPFQNDATNLLNKEHLNEDGLMQLLMQVEINVEAIRLIN